MDVTLPAINAFITDLIRQKFGDQTPDEATITDIKRELTDKLNQYLTLRTIEMVTATNPEAVNQLSELIKTNPTPEQVNTFIGSYVKEPDVLVAQFFTDFRNLYLGVEPPKTN